MTDAEALTQRIVICNHFVKLLDSSNQTVKLLVVHFSSIRSKSCGGKCRFDFKECKAAAKSIVQHSKAAVSRVHHTDNVNIARNGELFISIEKLQFNSSFVTFDQHKQLTENLAEIASVDFINDKEVRAIILSSFAAELIEYALLQFKARLCGTETHDKVFVTVTLMELNHLDTVIVFLAHDGECQTLCSEGLADAWCALQDHILFGKK